MKGFSEILAELLKEDGVSQKSLAAALGVSQQTVSRYVRGEREPDIKTILLIARYFGVTTDYLLGAKDFK